MQNIRKLGDMLLESGIITPQQLKEAEEVQARKGGKLGRVLLEKNFITEDVYLAYLGKQLGISYISLNEYGHIPESVLRIVPAKTVFQEQIVPVALDGNVLTVAMSDPINVIARDDLRIITGYDIKTVIALPQEISDFIAGHYGDNESVQIPAAEIPLTITDNFQKYPVLGELLLSAVKSEASEVHISREGVSWTIRFRGESGMRNYGLLEKAKNLALEEELSSFSFGKSTAGAIIPFKLPLKLSDRRIGLCADILHSSHGPHYMFRVRNATDIPKVEKLGFTESQIMALKRKLSEKGKVIVFTGSGAATTLYSSLDYLNIPDRLLASVENFSSAFLKGVCQLSLDETPSVNKRKALDSVLSMRPDALLYKADLNPEIWKKLVSASLSDTKVLMQIKSRDPQEALMILSSMGPSDGMIVSALDLIVVQRLMRKICKNCRQSYEVPHEILERNSLLEKNGKAALQYTFYKGTGCSECFDTGYGGFSAVFEFLEIKEAAKDMLLKGGLIHDTVAVLSRQLMDAIRNTALSRVYEGVTTFEEYYRTGFGNILQ